MSTSDSGDSGPPSPGLRGFLSALLRPLLAYSAAGALLRWVVLPLASARLRYHDHGSGRPLLLSRAALDAFGTGPDGRCTSRHRREMFVTTVISTANALLCVWHALRMLITDPNARLLVPPPQPHAEKDETEADRGPAARRENWESVVARNLQIMPAFCAYLLHDSLCILAFSRWRTQKTALIHHFASLAFWAVVYATRNVRLAWVHHFAVIQELSTVFLNTVWFLPRLGGPLATGQVGRAALALAKAAFLLSFFVTRIVGNTALFAADFVSFTRASSRSRRRVVQLVVEWLAQVPLALHAAMWPVMLLQAFWFGKIVRLAIEGSAKAK